MSEKHTRFLGRHCAMRIVAMRIENTEHGPAASSGSNPKAPGSARGCFNCNLPLQNFLQCVRWH